MEDGECEGYVHDHPDNSWSNSHIESHYSLLGVDLFETVREAVVLRCLKSLHLGLHNIDRVVEHGRAEPGKGSRAQINDNLVWDVATQEILGVFEDDEADSLVGRLLQ